MRSPPVLPLPPRRLVRILGRLLVPAALVALGALVIHDAERVRSFAWSVRPVRLAAATLLEVLLMGWAVVLWSRVLARFGGGQPPLRSLLRVWFRGNLAKYLPGGFWPLVTTAEMAERAGSSAIVLPASFLVHAAYSALGALAVAGVLAGGRGSGLAGVPAWVFPGGAAAALLLVHPAAVRSLVATAARLSRVEAPTWRGGWTGNAGLLLLYGLTWVGYGLAFSLFVSALVPTGGIPWWEMAGTNALAFVVGFVAVFAPGGLGVREAALAALLAPVIPSGGVRTLLSVASRLWLVATEMLAGALVLAVPGAPARKRAPPRSRPAPSAEDDAQPGAVGGNRVEVLAGSGATLGRIAAACRGARSSVWIAQLALDVDCISAADDPPERLVDALLAAASEREGRPAADVRVLLNGSILMNTGPALRRFLGSAGPAGERIRVRGLDVFPRILHAKLVLVDGVEAFLVGSPFANGYWDDGEHRPIDPARTDDDLAGRPIHDLSVHLLGPAVAELGRWFREVWDGAAATGAEEDPTGSPGYAVPVPAAAGPQSVRVLRTVPEGLRPALPGGRTDILRAYERAIGEARALVYIENQYFSSRPIRRALVDALEARPELEVILVLNPNPDITGYRSWQSARLREGGLLEHPRVGVFSLWASAPSRRRPGLAEVTQLFIHSKAAVVDDQWATLGTANLDGVSLDSYGEDFLRWPGQRIFRRTRNFDLNLEILDGSDGEPFTGAAAALRRSLWSHHLGMPECGLRERPAEGWLPLWREAARANAARLGTGAPRPLVGHLLPYVDLPRPRDQLRALGVPSLAVDLRFDPGWVEVLWSPGWLKKVVPQRFRRRG